LKISRRTETNAIRKRVAALAHATALRVNAALTASSARIVSPARYSSTKSVLTHRPAYRTEITKLVKVFIAVRAEFSLFDPAFFLIGEGCRGKYD